MIKFIKVNIILILVMLICASTPCLSAPVDFTGSTKHRETVSAFSFEIPEQGCALLIDLDIYTMIIYKDGLARASYPVSGGTDDSPSPTGTWHITSIENWGEGFGGSWIGLSVPWGTYGIHGTVQPWFLGEYNVSHGCIRMHDEDVAAVKKLVTVGSAVYIKHDTAAFRVMESGMIGSDVLKVQHMLSSLGFYAGAKDGIFGDYLEAAIKSFQQTYKLTTDGIVGRRTFNKICEQNYIHYTGAINTD